MFEQELTHTLSYPKCLFFERVKRLLSLDATVWHLCVCLSISGMSNDNFGTLRPIVVKLGTNLALLLYRILLFCN